MVHQAVKDICHIIILNKYKKWARFFLLCFIFMHFINVFCCWYLTVFYLKEDLIYYFKILLKQANEFGCMILAIACLAVWLELNTGLALYTSPCVVFLYINIFLWTLLNKTRKFTWCKGYYIHALKWGIDLEVGKKTLKIKWRICLSFAVRYMYDACRSLL